MSALAKSFEIRSGGSVGHANHLGTVGLEQSMKIEIAGVVDDHRISRLNQEPAEKVDCLRTRLGQHDLVGCGFNAMFRHATRKKLP